MELDSSIQIPSSQLQKQHFDAIIVVSGYETRCTYLVDQLDVSKIPVKIVLALSDHTESFSRKYNDQRFHELGFTFIHVPIQTSIKCKEIMDSFCLIHKKESIDILIDYSAMPKIWYQALINYFLDIEDSFTNVKLWFSYAPSEYTKSTSATSNKYFDAEIPSIKKDRNVVLLVGLGYEKGNSEELAKLVNAKTTFVYYSDPAIDERFVKDVLENNKALLQHIDQHNIISYPIQDLNSINESLTSLCVNLRVDNQVILAPVGPKPFTLMCFILAPVIRIFLSGK